MAQNVTQHVADMVAAAEREIETLPAAEAIKPRERDATERRGKCARERPGQGAAHAATERQATMQTISGVE